MKDNSFIAEYFKWQICLNIEQGVNLWHLLNQVLLAEIPGDVVELGSMTGMTASVMQRTIEDAGSGKQLVLFDSFEGLSEIKAEDGIISLIPENFKTSPDHTVERFSGFGLRQPKIVAGWFQDTIPGELPETICFAHLDADLYEPTLEALEGVYPRLPAGAVVVVDDYAEDALAATISRLYTENPYLRQGKPVSALNWLPGVQRAVEKFMADKPEEMCVLLARDERHAFFRKE